MTADWIPLFTKHIPDREILKPHYMFSTFRDGSIHCKLCEARISGTETMDLHARGHRRELRAYRKKATAAREREKAERAKARQEERDLERQVRGGGLPEIQRLKNRVTSARYKLKHPEKHGREEWDAAETKKLQAVLDEAIKAVEAYAAKKGGE